MILLGQAVLALFLQLVVSTIKIPSRLQNGVQSIPLLKHEFQASWLHDLKQLHYANDHDPPPQDARTAPIGAAVQHCTVVSQVAVAFPALTSCDTIMPVLCRSMIG